MVFIKMLKIVLHSFTAGVKVIRDLCAWLKAGVSRTGRVKDGPHPGSSSVILNCPTEPWFSAQSQ